MEIKTLLGKKYVFIADPGKRVLREYDNYESVTFKTKRDDIDFARTFYIVEKNGQVGVIDEDLQEVIPCLYLKIFPYKSCYFKVVTNDNRWGMYSGAGITWRYSNKILPNRILPIIYKKEIFNELFPDDIYGIDAEFQLDLRDLSLTDLNSIISNYAIIYKDIIQDLNNAQEIKDYQKFFTKRSNELIEARNVLAKQTKQAGQVKTNDKIDEINKSFD